MRNSKSEAPQLNQETTGSAKLSLSSLHNQNTLIYNLEFERHKIHKIKMGERNVIGLESRWCKYVIF